MLRKWLTPKKVIRGTLSKIKNTSNPATKTTSAGLGTPLHGRKQKRRDSNMAAKQTPKDGAPQRGVSRAFWSLEEIPSGFLLSFIKKGQTATENISKKVPAELFP